MASCQPWPRTPRSGRRFQINRLRCGTLAADIGQVTAWSSRAPEPFAGNAEFWRSVGASMDAFVALILATIAAVLAGAWGAVAFIVPLALLVRAAIAGRASERVTKPHFESHEAWRLAERQAVGAVMGKALIRPRWPFAR
jgi:hypothetical protein